MVHEVGEPEEEEMSASQAVVYAILAEAHYDSMERKTRHHRHTKRTRILPEFLG